MKFYTFYIPRSWLTLLDIVVDAGLYPNRAEAIREEIRDLLLFHGIFSYDFFKLKSKNNYVNTPRVIDAKTVG